MRSTETVSNPAARAVETAATALRPSWPRPRKLKAGSENDCTPSESVRTPSARHASHADAVTSSGFASRKTQGDSNVRAARHASITRASSSGGSCEGVPPPKYTVSNGRASAHDGAAMDTSETRREANRARAGDADDITEKSQYGQIVE